MKKTVIILAMLLCAAMASAQPDFSELKYGVRAGIGVGAVKTRHDDDADFMNGFQFTAGVFAELPIWNLISINTEINIERSAVSNHSKSVSIQDTGFGGVHIFTESSTKFPLAYVHIPVLAKFTLADLLYVEAGPQFGFLAGKVKTHAETSTQVGGADPTTTSTDSDDTDHFKKGHLAVAVGWGVIFGQFSAGLRAAIGANDIQAPDYKLDGYRVTHTDIQLALRYSF